MDILVYIWQWILPFLMVFTILVFVHELGHYWVARRTGVRVETFSIGFGPEIFGWLDRQGTRWKLSAIPLGGYVKMFGENDFGSQEKEPLTPAEAEVSFHHKRPAQRAAIVAAGPIANFVFAIVLLAALFALVGVPMPRAVLGEIQKGSAAEEAGFRSGDVVLRIDGQPIDWFEDLRRIVSARPSEELSFTVLREGAEVSLVATPRPAEIANSEPGARRIGVLGVSPDPAQLGYERSNPFTAVWQATERTYALVVQILKALSQIIVGERTAEELGGPLRIAQLSGEMAQGGIVSLIFFMAALSINLGLINLFPIPMLDGGHLAFYAIEMIRGKPLDQRVQEYGLRFGLVFVLLLMIFATWNDLVHLEVFEFLRQFVT